jgi:hypothetical protein
MARNDSAIQLEWHSGHEHTNKTGYMFILDRASRDSLSRTTRHAAALLLEQNDEWQPQAAHQSHNGYGL